jgi:hypothetical protein
MKPTSVANPSASKEEFQEPPLSLKLNHSSGYELHPGLISMVRALPFSGHDDENPCQHLLDFEEMCSCLSISGMTQETLRWKLFSFSLMGRAKQWYTDAIEKHECGPKLSLLDGVILRLFCTGLNIADLCRDMIAGGHFTHKPMTEQVEFLENFISKHTSSIIRTKPLLMKVMLSVEESSLVESQLVPSQVQLMSPHPNHKHQRNELFILWSLLSNSRSMVEPRTFIGMKRIHFFLRKSPLM